MSVTGCPCAKYAGCYLSAVLIGEDDSLCVEAFDELCSRSGSVREEGYYRALLFTRAAAKVAITAIVLLSTGILWHRLSSPAEFPGTFK